MPLVVGGGTTPEPPPSPRRPWRRPCQEIVAYAPFDEDVVLFEVNGWHNALHLIVGALGLVAFSRPGLARVFAIGWGGTAAVLAVWGTLSSYPAFGLIPGGMGGVILHLSDASLGIFTWLLSAPSRLSVSPSVRAAEPIQRTR